MKKRIALLLACLLVIAALTACSAPAENGSANAAETPAENSQAQGDAAKSDAGQSAGADKKEITIGLTSKDLTIPAYTSITNILQGICDENGVQLTLVSASNDPSKMASQIENFVQNKVDVIIICEAVDPSAASSSVKEAVAAGVPVIGYGVEVEGNTTALVCPNYDIGYASGEMCADWIKENYDSKGKIGIVTAPLVAQSAIDRYNGAKDAIGKMVPDVEIVAEQPAENMEQGMKVVENMIQANPDLVAVISNTGGGAMGGSEALIAAGKNDGKIGVFGVDTTTDLLSAVKDQSNPLLATVCVGSDSYMANKLYELSMMIVNGDPLEDVYLSELEKLDASNIDDFITRENITL